MKYAFSRALNEYIRGRFEPGLVELDGSSERKVYLAAPLAGGPLVVLVLEPSDRGRFEADEVDRLSGEHRIGTTVCPDCGADAAGWPRFCARCHRDHAGLPVAGEEPAGSIDALQRSVERRWPGARLIGTIPYRDGDGAMHFVQRARGVGRAGKAPVVVGMVVDRVEDGEMIPVPCWAMDPATLASFADTAPSAAEPSVPSGTAAAALNQDLDDTLPGHAVEVDTKHALPLLRRPQVWASAALLLLVVMVSLGLRDEAPARVSTVTPATVVTPQPPDSGAAVVPPPADTQPELATTLPGRPPRRRVDSVTAVDTPHAPPPSGPDTAADRARVAGLAAEFGQAFGSRDMAQVRAAYRGITAAEDTRWTGWFRRLNSLRARFIVDAGPVLYGDSAQIDFTLPLRYSQKNPVGESFGEICMVFRGTLHRTADGWGLDRLNERPAMPRERCEPLTEDLRPPRRPR